MVCDHAWGRPMPRRYLDKAPIHAEDRSFFCAICFNKYGLFQIFFCLLKSYVMNVSLSHMLSSGRLDERSPFLYLICKRFKSIFDLQKVQFYIWCAKVSGSYLIRKRLMFYILSENALYFIYKRLMFYIWYARGWLFYSSYLLLFIYTTTALYI